MSAAQRSTTAACPKCGSASIVAPNNFTVTRGQISGRVTFGCGWSGNITPKMSGAHFTQIAPCKARKP